MERNISPAAILCIVLVSLAAVIGLGYGAFAITKGSANDGTQEVATQTSAASKSWKDTYDAKDVTGAQVQSLVKEAESKGIAVFINTRGMSQGTINSSAEVPVLKHNGKYYMNYGTVFDYEDDSYKKTSGEISMAENSGLLGVRDGSSLKVDYNPKLQDGKLVRHEDYTGLYTNGAINYIDTHAKFRSNLIYGNDGEVVGVILSQVNRPGASLPLSSGGGFVNGSGSLGGSSGVYIPSHSGGGNIPMSSGGGSYAPSTGGGVNASGPSTKPSTPAPETTAGEHLITFDTRGGSTIDYQKVATGGKVTKPSAPSRTGYGFAGWYTDSSCTTKYNFSRVINTDVTLYARWFMWGDADNDGKVTREDSKLAAQWRDGTFDNLVLPCSVYVYTALSEKNIGNADVILIGNKANYSLSSFKVDSTTRGYEFDLENGYYYDTQGNKYKLPTNKAAGLIPIPTGCTYYVGVTGSDFGDYTGATAVLKAGDIFPEAKNGDVVIYGDYEYRLTTLGSWEVKVIDKTKSSYGPILSEINDVSVVYMMSTFKDCSNMKKAPEIPETVTNIHYAFANCTSLETAPILHSGVMVPAYAFQNCTSLTGTVVIHANITGTSYTGCFSGTEKPILLKGTCSKLIEFASTGEKGNVSVYGMEKIPEGGTYYVGITNHVVGNYTGATQTLSAGNYFPSTVNPGDVYVYGDYEYRYELKSNGGGGFNKSEGNSWGVRVINTNKTNYGSILSSINGKDVKNLTFTFSECRSMVVSPVLPETTTLMDGTFFECYELKSAPIIPSNVTTLECAFFMCESLTEAPVIPNKVTNMNDTFDSCSNLVSVPNIPANVSNLGMTFYACKKLTGTINIDCSNLTDLSSCFSETVLPILLTGSCNKLYDLAATSKKGNVTVLGSNTIPVGGVYYTGVTTNRWGDYEILDYTGGTAHTGGSQYPGEAKVGDVLVYGDYEYRFGMRYNGSLWFVDSSIGGWSVASKNWSSSELGTILPEINDYSVVFMAYAFQNNKITKSPVIPSTVVNMDNAYDSCTKLSVPPVIPNGVKSLYYTFINCDALKEPPVIPSTVRNMTATFFGSGITKAPNIPNGITELFATFYGSDLAEAPVIPNSVISMYETFTSCSNLKTPPVLPSNLQRLESVFWGAGIETAPVIPASVTNMDRAFVSCKKLTGTVRIHANPTSYTNAFGGTVLPITLVGNSSKLAEIAATGDNGNVSVQY